MSVPSVNDAAVETRLIKMDGAFEPLKDNVRLSSLPSDTVTLVVAAATVITIFGTVVGSSLCAVTGCDT